MRQFSLSWKGSVKPKKQRKYRFKAPLHIRRKLMRIHLSSDLKQKQKMRSIAVRVGDKVKVIKGDFKKSEGKVERVDMKEFRVFVAGIERQKKDGTKALVGISPASLLIVELNFDDKRRIPSIDKEKVSEAKEKPMKRRKKEGESL